MVIKRYAFDLGGANHRWLNSKHLFGFANCYDPKASLLRELMVVNDRIAPHTGFDIILIAI